MKKATKSAPMSFGKTAVAKGGASEPKKPHAKGPGANLGKFLHPKKGAGGRGK